MRGVGSIRHRMCLAGPLHPITTENYRQKQLIYFEVELLQGGGVQCTNPWRQSWVPLTVTRGKSLNGLDFDTFGSLLEALDVCRPVMMPLLLRLSFST